MRIPSLFPRLRGCRVDDVHVSDGAITLALTGTRATAPCPSCRRRSRHPHSRYRRRVTDQPWAGHPVTLVLHGRRFLQWCTGPRPNKSVRSNSWCPRHVTPDALLLRARNRRAPTVLSLVRPVRRTACALGSAASHTQSRWSAAAV